MKMPRQDKNITVVNGIFDNGVPGIIDGNLVCIVVEVCDIAGEFHT